MFGNEKNKNSPAPSTLVRKIEGIKKVFDSRTTKDLSRNINVYLHILDGVIK